MFIKLLSFLFVFKLILFSSEYTTNATAFAIDKNSACQKALNRAKSEAISQAGTFVMTSINDRSSEKDGEFSSSFEAKINAISLGIVKTLSKQESVTVTKDYQFMCQINATFHIDEVEMRKTINNYLAKDTKKIDNNKIVIRATGYSEDGQSRYSAFKVAKIDATRNLLDEIKGSDFFSTLEADSGRLAVDKVINGLNGNIRFVKVLSRTYDRSNKSAEIIVGLTQKGLNDNIKRYRNQ